MERTDPMLSVDSLSVNGPRGEALVTDASFSVAPGEIMGLVGPNGSAKTTILRAIAGLIPARRTRSAFERVLQSTGVEEARTARGHITLDGVAIDALPPSERHVAIIRQDAALLPFRTARENIALPLRLLGNGRRESLERATAMAERLGLKRWLDLRPPALSGGVQQRVAIARALVGRPKALCCDEPFASLDVEAREEASALLREVVAQERVAGVLVTHQVAEAARLCARVAFLDAGRIHQVATLAEAWARPATPFVARLTGRSEVIEGVLDEGRRFRPLGAEGYWVLPAEVVDPAWPVGARLWLATTTLGLRAEEVADEAREGEGVQGVEVGRGFDAGAETVRVRVGKAILSVVSGTPTTSSTMVLLRMYPLYFFVARATS